MSRHASQIETLMTRAVQASLSHVETGGLPFVGQVISGGAYASDPGVNLVRETGDPSAHAEIVAMRRAMRDLRTTSLEGATLLATGEPCGLCYRFAADHGIEGVYFAIDRDTASEYGFDYRVSYPALRTDQPPVAQAAQHLPVDAGLEPFIRYAELHLPEIAAPR